MELVRLEICTPRNEAWRYPCYSISDLQLIESVLPPVGVAIADNAVTYSDKGHGNTLMAGRKLGI